MAIEGEAPGTKILVVDDDLTVGTLIAEMLIDEGYIPIICVHPREALDFSAKDYFSLAFVDINMPGMNGFELASKLKEQRPFCEIIFITGSGSFEDAIQAIKIGAYDYLRKPFGLNELKLCVKRFQERRELKDRIRFAEQRYFHLVQNIPSLVFVIRRDFQLDFINRASEPMLGYDPDEVMENPKWFLEHLHPEDINHIKKMFQDTFQSKNSRFFTECRMIHRDGHIIHVIISSIANVEAEKSGEFERLEGTIVDITEHVFLEKAVVQREKLKLLGAISAEVAHGIRNPLVSIGGFARRLRKRFKELPEGDIILRESERLEKILHRIAEYLKPVEIKTRECSINDIVTECLNQLLSEIKDEGIECRIKLDSTLSVINVDKEVLSSVFADLIKNAKSEMKDTGGILHIRTFEKNDYIHIEFVNPFKSAKARDTEPFFLPFNSSDQEVGLPLSYRLIKSMGGLLSYSQGEKDMIFTVSLPKRSVPASEMDGVVMS